MVVCDVLGASSLRALFWMGAILYLGALFSERHGFGTGEVGLVYLASGVGYLAGSAAAGSWLGGSAPRATYAATTIGSGALFGLAFAVPFGAGVAVACVTLASLLAPFGWVTLAAMLSSETPRGAGDDYGTRRVGLQPRGGDRRCGGWPAARLGRLRGAWSRLGGLRCSRCRVRSAVQRERMRRSSSCGGRLTSGCPIKTNF